MALSADKQKANTVFFLSLDFCRTYIYL